MMQGKMVEPTTTSFAALLARQSGWRETYQVAVVAERTPTLPFTRSRAGDNRHVHGPSVVGGYV
jgi:hypothetical protein